MLPVDLWARLTQAFRQSHREDDGDERRTAIAVHLEGEETQSILTALWEIAAELREMRALIEGWLDEETP